MEMVRMNPALLPGVKPPDGVRVNGRKRPARAPDAGVRPAVRGPIDESSWLYQANQLGQFLHLPEPAIFKSDAANAAYSRQPGDLLDGDSFQWTEVAQGGIGDCYLIASLSALLYADPKGPLAQGLIVPRSKGGKVVSYYVNFFQATGRKLRIEVDPDLVRTNSDGHLLYASSTQNQPGAEEWAPSLMEKAYARWQGSFNAIGNGGYAADALHALTGKKSKHYAAGDSKLIAAIEAAANQGRPQVSCTKSASKSLVFPTGIYADHCYTLRGIDRVGGEVFVQVRNPWGPGSASDAEPTEPPSADGTPDGLFQVNAVDFIRYWDGADILP
jgi:hypothetical protein